MKKIVSVLLTVLMLCQCFTFVSFASEGVVEAPTKELIFARIPEHADWYVANPSSTLVTRGMYMHLYTDNAGNKSPQTGNDNDYYWNAGNAADNTEGGVYTLDTNNPSMKYVALSNDTYKTTQWGIYNWKNANTVYFSDWPDKTTFDITFLDESNASHKRTAGTGKLFGEYGKSFIDLGPNAATTENYMKAPGSNKTFGAANRWIDLRIEVYNNGDNVKTRSSWWKYHEEADSAWKQLDDKVATGNISYAIFGPMTSDDTDTARILLNNFTATRTYRANVESVAIGGVETETGASDIPYDTDEITVTFDQTMADGQEDNIKLVKQDGSEADITVTTEDDRIYTIAINGTLAPEAEYSIDLSDCVSRHELYIEDEFTFTVGESPIIDALAAEDISKIDWKKSNTIDINFSSAIVPSTVNEDTVKLQFADGTPVNDVPLLVEANATSAQITIGQLQAWTDYKLVFTDEIAPADDANIFNGAEVLFGTDHADIYEYDFNKEGSSNAVVANMTTYGTTALTVSEKENPDDPNYSRIFVDASEGTTKKQGILMVPAEFNDSALTFQYKMRNSTSSVLESKIALYGDKPANYAVSLVDTRCFISGTQVGENDGKFKEIKVNMSADPVNQAGQKPRTTSTYFKTNNGWEMQGSAKQWTDYFRPAASGAEWIEIFRLQHYSGYGQVGPTDFARIVVSSNPKADVMKSEVDYNKSEITVVLGKNMAADQDAIVVKKGSTAVDATVTQENSNTFTIKLDEVVIPGTEYTLDMSALMCADGVVGAENYTFTTPKAPIAADIFSISGNTGSVQVTNNTGAPLTYTVIVAVYDAKNSLKKVAYETYSLAATEGTQSELHTVTADLSEYASADKTGWTSTLMLWKGNISDVSPVRASVDGTIQ